MLTNPAVSIVIPAYKSAEILPELVRQLGDTLGAIWPGGKFEVIIVNDASPDNTWQVLEKLANSEPWLKAVNLRKNSGQHSALMAGMRLASGATVVLMDDDLQHSPADVQRLCAVLDDNVDVCYAAFPDKKHARWKIWGSRFNNWTSEFLIEKPTGLQLSSFKALKKEIVDEVVKYSGPFPYVDGLILACTSRAANLEVRHNLRHSGAGNYSFFASLFLWTKMAINFSVVPLRIASLLGAAFSTLGLSAALLLVFLKISHIAEASVPGWSSVVVLMLLIGGVQLLALGAIGEYLGRTYVHLNGKPQYLIQKKVGFEDIAATDFEAPR
ncbi:MAG: glycosyltransferase family 2 protein [Polaromonas sp.]|nr:glycosyltransferase family 2 protein [Polaromonas sp.]